MSCSAELTSGPDIIKKCCFSLTDTTSAECYNVLSPFFEKLRKWGSKFATLNLV